MDSIKKSDKPRQPEKQDLKPVFELIISNCLQNMVDKNPSDRTSIQIVLNVEQEILKLL